MILRNGLFVLFCGLSTLGCGGSSGGGGLPLGSTTAPTTSGSPAGGSAGGQNTTAAPINSADWPRLAAQHPVEAGNFTTSPVCATCHGGDVNATAMRDAKGRNVSPFDLWKASMMANATRDPLWRAQVEVEIAATPSMQAAIEAKCMSCHAPLALGDAKKAGESLKLADLHGKTKRTQLALDGVSCTSCHQIQPTTDVTQTFNGNYQIGVQREVFGPYASPYGSPMANRTGFLPVEGSHIRESTSCASCHTLYTQAVRADGSPTGGSLPEQTPYLEWQNSVFNDEVARPGPKAANCSDCHAPQTDEDGQQINTRIARKGSGDYPIQPRNPYGRHTFLGGNTLIPAILRDQAKDLKPLASAQALAEVERQTRKQLAQDTARVAIQSARRLGQRLAFSVRVTNRTGHKFPTGHPVRRAWVRLRVLDAQGAVVFASGAYDSAGRIVDGSGKVLASELAGGPHQGHQTTITSGSQVQIYQSLMHDEAGKLTFLLLRGEGYLKDNRILPEGWDPKHPAARDTAPRGVSDADFQGGSDTLGFEVSAPAAAGPYRVEATLLYQTLSARYAQELFRYRTPAVDAFKSYYEAAKRTPELVAQATQTLP